MLVTKSSRIKKFGDILQQRTQKGWGLSLLLTLPLAVLAVVISWPAFKALPGISWIVGYGALFLSV